MSFACHFDVVFDHHVRGCPSYIKIGLKVYLKRVSNIEMKVFNHYVWSILSTIIFHGHAVDINMVHSCL